MKKGRSRWAGCRRGPRTNGLGCPTRCFGVGCSKSLAHVLFKRTESLARCAVFRVTVRKTGGANATQAAHAPWRDPRQTEITDGPSSPSAPFGGSYLTILRHLAAY